MNFKPSEDRVVIDPIESKKISEGGIHIPDNALEKPIKGKIMAVGPDARRGEKTAEFYTPGEIVLYHRYAGTEVELEGQSYLIMRAKDVFGGI